jgi:alkylation response protein AidB-like acyl-CoA dehydrogenase
MSVNMSDFFQEGPVLDNQYGSDFALRSYLRRALPRDLLKSLEPGLHALGARAAGDVLALGYAAEASPPKHIPYDPWGRRIDSIEVCEAWKTLESISAEEKLVATAYERKEGEFSRIHQMVRIYLFGPSSAIYTCPLAMTDGAARAIELYGDEHLKSHAFARLTSSDPARFWTSGQWMTERTGGSDVSTSQTIATREGSGFRLHGTKWFTSATTSQMAMTLARIEGAPAGSAGLSLFYLELRDAEGRLNRIFVHRLKDKLGTRALPTAELTLQGTPATLVGGEGNGVRKISSLFNITRVWNACTAASFMRRGIALSRSYADKRSAFGKLLIHQPLHVETLAEMQIEFEAALLLTFRTVELLGKEEVGKSSTEESALLRILTPVAKLYTGKQSITVASETLECFGGAGYIEDTGLPRLLRDSQVLSIWEGTTNVLSLDLLRAIQKEKAFEPLLADLEAQLRTVQDPKLAACAEKVRAAARSIATWLTQASADPEALQAGARSLAFSVARAYCGALLLAHAQWALTAEGDDHFAISARRWCERDLAPLIGADSAHRKDSRALV